jgi:hypothetical protein
MSLADAVDCWRRELAPRLAGIDCAAALLGPGSEMLGYDDARSTDHDWPPQVTVFTTADIRALLPRSFEGLSVRGVVVSQGLPAPTSWPEWLALAWQRIAESVGGVVLRDDDGSLSRDRAHLRWYPDEVWRYVLACQWRRIAQQEAFPGRCAEVGDALGAAVITAAISRDLMHLALLQARVWPPYAKWLGSAFARLPEVDALLSALLAGDLAAAYPLLAARQNALELCPALDVSVRPYLDRPYPVIGGDRFADALRATLDSLQAWPLTGSVDQQVDSTDLLTQQGEQRGVVRIGES